MHGPHPLDIESIAVRAGQHRTTEGEHCEPIFTTSSFVFNSAAEAASRFVDDAPGNVYSRFTNPTVATFERRLAALESGEYGLATASGMAAIQLLCQSVLKAGDHVVVSASVFGSTITLFDKILSRFAIGVSFVDLNDLTGWRQAIRDNTKMLFVETPSNPLGRVANITELSALAKHSRCILVVDNAVATPILQRPLELGADVVVHSATKFLDGQGRCVGGAIITNSNQIYSDCFAGLRACGPSMSPFNAWVFLKGLETLPLRMKQHCINALELAVWLETQPAVRKVFYPGLHSHPDHQLASSQQTGFGAIVSFEVHGERADAWLVIDSTEMLSITGNLGDTKTTITHPATTTHGRLTEQQRHHAGIQNNLIRLAVGLESVNDIKTDLLLGLSKLSKDSGC
jgi:O-succinylhomoserine sulfhydrylase